MSVSLTVQCSNTVSKLPYTPVNYSSYCFLFFVSFLCLQMLQAAANLAPRGVYVCGNTTTASGLTVTLSKEAGSGGDYALEAGALVLADQGG